MNVRLLSLIERRMNRAVQLLSEFLSNHKNPENLPEKQITDYTQLVMDTYIALFKALEIVPGDYLYTVREIQVHHQDEGEIFCGEQLDTETRSYLHEMIKSASDQPLGSGYSVVPLHLKYFRGFSDFSALFGLCVIDHSTQTAQSFFHEFRMDVRQMNFSDHTLNYLDDILLKFKADPSVHIRDLSKINNLSYLQFQKDCRQYFGTTFYDFTIKLKMIDVVDDLMFSNLMVKEIVYKYKFAEYSNMYKFFHRTYDFPFKNITRLYSMEKV
ncbi:helix-turn-helix domain-containing protein [Chryseobacterium sp. OSA05B]|uniref:helix-turn-helix domain-containing protein n=1 Tax=Chryseobacterium sp. OSA05B TaxID=2862650 RepID=UPI001CC01B2F|nr:helix-turn-helix domain-containing protein [Chryseobacterium sp. OSA05B]